LVRRYIITAVLQLANLSCIKHDVQTKLAIYEHIQSMKSKDKAQGRHYLLAQQTEEAPMASQEAGHHGADIDAQYAKCVLVRSLRHAEERDIEGSGFDYRKHELLPTSHHQG